MARPTKYKPEFAEQAKKICETFGAIDEEVASFLGVSVATLYNWKLKYPEFLEALKVGKQPSNERVTDSLYRLATGFTYPDTDIRVINGKIVKTTVMRYQPPNVTAVIFHKKNREPDLWRDKQELEVDLRGNLAENLAKARRRAARASDAET